MSPEVGGYLAGVRTARLIGVLSPALAASLALAGCGTGTDRTQVREVTARFFAALDGHRAGDACRQLSPSLRKTLAQEHAAPDCAAAVAKVKTRGSPVKAVRVYATSARLDLAGGESVFLSSMRDGWRIDALGCLPRSSGPYECEEQG
jgi:hypothetical protein